MSNRVMSIAYKGTIENRSDANSLLASPGEFVIIERGVPRLLTLRCPCGCGDDLIINLDERSGPAWKLYFKKDKLSLYPSYWRDTACGSHFIIWNNNIYWFNRVDDEFESYFAIDDEIENLVLENLPIEFTHYTVIADTCGLIPWECLQACRQLVKKKLCIGKSRGYNRYFKQNLNA